MRKFLFASALLLLSCTVIQSQDVEGKWLIRYNQAVAREFFTSSTSQDGFTIESTGVKEETQDLYVFYHLKLEKPIKGLRFDYTLTGDASILPITLFDAAANELWDFSDQDAPPGNVELSDLKVRGQLIFRISRNQAVDLPGGWGHSISNIKLTADNQEAILDEDGFILVGNMTEFRGYACEDNVKVRLKPGPYQIDKALCRQFVEFTGSNSSFDLKGARIMVDTKLFSQSDVAQGVYDDRLYAAMGIHGDHITMEGIYIETYGDRPGITSRNKIFNITGEGITLKNAEVRTSGSSPWGYGSFYGLGGGDVRKMNGIRVGWPARDVKLVGCKVHMRAMGHAIFIQGAKNTLIEDCHVDGLLRTTDDLLAETSGYAFDRDFKAARGGYIEGVMVAEDGKILPGEMFSLSEDGIRMYPRAQQLDETKTGSTTIINCTVTNMRRGICTGLSSAGDKVINCQVSNCVATGFNVGNGDTLINCRADAKYAEAVCLPYNNAQNAMVELEILDSRKGMKNTLLAKINGTGHKVSLQTSDHSNIPENMVIKLSTTEGYGGPRRNDRPSAVNIHLNNETPAKIILLPGTRDAQVKTSGFIEDQTANEKNRP